MPPEPLPWDRKDCFKERKHERSESLGSFGRWRDSSHLRRPPGHGKQGGWHLSSEESGHGYVPVRSGDRMHEDETCRPSVSRGDGRYGRSGRDNKGSFGQRDWRGGHSWETSNASPNLPVRLHDVNTDQRSVDDMLPYSSHPHSDFVNTLEKDQHDKTAVNGLGTGQICERESSLGSADWKPLKWNRSGSLSSRGSGFSHSGSSKSMGAIDSNEAKAEVQPKKVILVKSPSGDAVTCETSDPLTEERTSRKKPRLGWGEGLAKYEKKKVEGPDESVNKSGAIFSATNTEAVHSLCPNLAEKSPQVTGFSDCASPATPSSVACSSSSGLEEKSFSKGANNDNDVSNLCGSPSPGSQNHLEGFSFNLEKLDVNSLANVGSALTDLLRTDDPCSVDSSFVRSTMMNKLLVWKDDISKALEMTESEIDLLENELKSLKSESGVSCPFPAVSSSLPVEGNTKSCKEQGPACNTNPRPAPLQISPENEIVEKMLLCNGAMEEVHSDVQDEDMDSPGTATSKFVEQISLVKAVSPSVELKHGECSGNLGAAQSTNVEVKFSVLGSNGEIDHVSTCGDVSMLVSRETVAPVSSDLTLDTAEETLYNSILASNKEYANRASELFNKLLAKDQYKIDVAEAVRMPCCQNDLLIKGSFSSRKQFLRFKERAIVLKYRALKHSWEQYLHLLSIRKYHTKSQKKFESSLRTTHNGYQKYRSAVRSRFSSPAGNLSFVPTNETIDFTSKLLLDSQVKPCRNTLKMPALILDKKEKKVLKFVSSNGLVEDPCSVEKERALINPWMAEERDIFMDKLVTFGKNFSKIASFLDHKTTADCVDFYYMNHKSDWFQKIKKLDVRKHEKSFSSNMYLVASGKIRNREMNAASLDMLGAASVMAAHADSSMLNRQKCSGRLFLGGGYTDSKTPQHNDGILDKTSIFDILGNDRETVAADVLAGICGSLSSEAMSSCITSSVDPGEGYKDWKLQTVESATKRHLTPDVAQNVDDETCSDESCGEMDPADWTDEEKSIFIQAVSSYGKDFVMISRCVRTRSRDQCKVFFSKARKCLGLDLIHPGGGNVGKPVSDDANGSESDAEDACAVESGSVICSDKLGCKVDEDLQFSVTNISNVESDPVETMNLQTDLNRSEDNKRGMEQLELKNAEAVETLVFDARQTVEKPELVFNGGSNIMNGVVRTTDSMTTDSMHTLKNTVLPANSGGRDQIRHQGNSAVESACAKEAIVSCPSSSNEAVETEAVTEISTKGLENELEGKECLLPENVLNNGRDEKCDADTSDHSGLQSSIQDSNKTGNASHLAADTSSCSGFSLNPGQQCQASPELYSMEKSQVVSLKQECALPNVNSVSQDSAAVQCEETRQNSAAVRCEKIINQDRLSPTLDFQYSGDKQCHKSVSRDDYHQHLMGPRLNHTESSKILRGYPLRLSTKKEMNGEISRGRLSEIHGLSKSDRNLIGQNMAQDCHLPNCNSSKPNCSVSGFSHLSQNLEQTSDYPKVHSRSLSDTEKPSRNGNVKLFGQILSHPSSLQKSNSNTYENEEKGPQHPKFSSKSSNIKFSDHRSHHNSADGNPAVLKFNRNNYPGLENIPVRSYGFWDGSRIQTGFSSLPDSAVLLSKYPAAFGSYPSSSSRIEQRPLQSVVRGNERGLNVVSVIPARETSNSNGLNGVSLIPARETSSSNGVVDYQVYRSRDNTRVKPFTVDMKQGQDIFTEMQIRNGFEAISSLQQQQQQQQGRGVVGMNVVGGGILVGAPCNGVTDPVAAIKMHFAKTDQFGGSTGSIIREEESWRGGKGDLDR